MLNLTLCPFGTTFSLNRGDWPMVAGQSMKRKISIAIPAVMLGALLLASPAWAQRGFGGKAAPSGHAAAGRSSAGGVRFAHSLRRSLRYHGNAWGYRPGWGYLPSPEGYSQGDYESATFGGPQMAMFEAPRPEKVIQPILIEQQGNEWVQVSGYKEATVSTHPEAVNLAEAAHALAVAPEEKTATVAASKVPPAILVFRDGHQEEVKSYTIIGGTIIAKADYWVSGAWTRKIDIANLDVTATLKLNEQQGSRFRLPTGPQEVVIRP